MWKTEKLEYMQNLLAKVHGALPIRGRIGNGGKAVRGVRLVSLCLSALLVCSVSAGCGGQRNQSTNVSGEKKQYRLVFFVKNVVNPFWKECRDGADAAAKELGNVKIEHVAPTKAEDVEESVRIVEDTITRFKAGQVDAMVFVPVDYKALVPVVQKANQAGLPIINYCNELVAGGEYVSFVGLDEEQMAYDVAKYIGNRLGGKGNVIVLQGVPGSLTGEMRQKGFMRGLSEFKGIKVLATQPSNYNRAQAMQVMENLLQQFPDVDAVMCPADEDALGAIQALERFGRLEGTLVSGINATKEGVEAVKAGRLTVTADYRGFEQGYRAVKAAVEFLEGKTPEKRIILEHVLVDKNNVDEWLSKKSENSAA